MSLDFSEVTEEQYKQIYERANPKEKPILKKAYDIHKARQSPGDFAFYASGGNECRRENHDLCVKENTHWCWAPHFEIINKALVRAANEPSRIIISCPPRIGKSYLSSGFNPAWFVGTNPDKKILILSHTASLAKEFGEQSRNLIEEFGPEVFGVEIDDSSAAKEAWGIKGKSGKVFSAGVKGSITGKGGHLVIIDDPIKSQEEALSKTTREKLQNLYMNVIRTRLEQDASIVIIMTRWSPYDLAGWLMENDEEGEWEEIRLPMICDEEPDLQLGREIGDPIWPAKFDRKASLEIKHDVSPLIWNALFQQKPVAQETTMFPNHKWGRAEEVPRNCKVVRRWDLSASSSTDADFSAGVLMARDQNSRYYIIDVAHFKYDEYETEEAVRAVAERDKEDWPKAQIILEQAGGAGLIVANNYVKNVLAGFNAKHMPVKGGDKTERGIPFSAQLRAGNVFIVQHYNEERGVYIDPPWVRSFIEEAFEFPGGKHDDMIDAAIWAFIDLTSDGWRGLHIHEKAKIISPSQMLSTQLDKEISDEIEDILDETEKVEKPRSQRTSRVISASNYRRHLGGKVRKF